jgi:Tol biopolymer transport system component
MRRKDGFMSKKILCSRNIYLPFLALSVGSLVLALDNSRSSLPRKDSHTPEVMASDWRQPKRLGSPVNTSRPEDAIEISPDGKRLFFMYAKDLLENMSPKEMLSRPNGTYVATRIGGPTDFSKPVFYDLGKGTSLSLDGELSFSPDGTTVYFHSNRAENTGRQQDPPKDDPVDIYVADIVNGVPTPARNLGPPVNSAYPDGEHAIHPDGVTLYFTSSRPGSLGKNDIWMSKQDGKSWSKPVNLGTPINSGRNELQPAFTSDGETMYFSSDRNPGIGMAIYRSKRIGNSWTKPGLVMKGIVGEPSITADGKYLYFVQY